MVPSGGAEFRITLPLAQEERTIRNVASRSMRPAKRDALLIYTTGLLRSAAVSLVGVTLAIDLADAGFSTTQIGLLIGAGLAGSPADARREPSLGCMGRRRILIALALLGAAGYLALATFATVGALVPLAFVGMRLAHSRQAAGAMLLCVVPYLALTGHIEMRTSSSAMVTGAPLEAHSQTRGHSPHALVRPPDFYLAKHYF